MRIYFDVCCLNRPFDEQIELRVQVETEAVRAIMQRVQFGEYTWITSAAVRYEARRNPDISMRVSVLKWIALADQSLRTRRSVAKRATALQFAGFPPLDALHVAFAEAGRCDILFTVDDKFLRRAARLRPAASVRVVNPAKFVLESPDVG